MTTDNRHLPGSSTQMLLTNGGIETSMIYHDGPELPSFSLAV